MDDDTQRIFETKDGLKSVPSTQQPVDAQSYFANANLPTSMKRMNIFVTEAGPVIERKPKAEWTEQHDRLVENIAKAAHGSIQKNGYYLPQTTRHLKGLAAETTKSLDDIFKNFQAKFAEVYGAKPGELVTAWRIENNLAVKAHQTDAQHAQEPEL